MIASRDERGMSCYISLVTNSQLSWAGDQRLMQFLLILTHATAWLMTHVSCLFNNNIPSHYHRQWTIERHLFPPSSRLPTAIFALATFTPAKISLRPLIRWPWDQWVTVWTKKHWLQQLFSIWHPVCHPVTRFHASSESHRQQLLSSTTRHPSLHQILLLPVTLLFASLWSMKVRGSSTWSLIIPNNFPVMITTSLPPQNSVWAHLLT